MASIDSRRARRLEVGARVLDRATGEVGTIVAVGYFAQQQARPTGRHPLDALIDMVAEQVEQRLLERRRAEAVPTRLVPLPEAAAILGRTPAAVYKMLSRGELHGVKRPGGRRVFIELAEIRQYIARNRQGQWMSGEVI
jgi:predicted DNA-binding transcriptional regulator AlpA